jgi:hypothetical protein
VSVGSSWLGVGTGGIWGCGLDQADQDRGMWDVGVWVGSSWLKIEEGEVWECGLD